MYYVDCEYQWPTLTRDSSPPRLTMVRATKTSSTAGAEGVGCQRWGASRARENSRTTICFLNSDSYGSAARQPATSCLCSSATVSLWAGSSARFTDSATFSTVSCSV